MADGIALINLYTSQAWVFQFFPEGDETEDQTNWELQDATIGIKSLMYANCEPQRIEISNVLLDSSDSGQSLTPEIEELRALMKETPQRTPPILRYICGDSQKRVVLERLRVRREVFSHEGNPLRARLSLTLLEFVQLERTTVRFVDPDDEAAGFNPIGNF